MSKSFSVSDSELPVMKVLWEKGELPLSELLSYLEGNKNTLKTFLKRLVEKGIVGVHEINSRTYRYFPIVKQEEYINQERKGFLQKVFDGSKKKMLLNFVKEEQITKEDLTELLKMIEEG